MQRWRQSRNAISLYFCLSDAFLLRLLLLLIMMMMMMMMSMMMMTTTPTTTMKRTTLKKKKKMEKWKEVVEEAKRRAIIWSVFISALAYFLSRNYASLSLSLYFPSVSFPSIFYHVYFIYFFQCILRVYVIFPTINMQFSCPILVYSSYFSSSFQITNHNSVKSHADVFPLSFDSASNRPLILGHDSVIIAN